MSTRTHFIVWIILLAGCIDDAPRDNPLDPLSPGSEKRGTMSGRVIVAHQTTGIEGVAVSRLGSESLALTDALGYFSFEDLKEGVHTFVCTKENFTNDTFQVEIRTGLELYAVWELNSAPAVVSQKIMTRKVDVYFPNPQYFVDIIAEMSDPNGFNEIDSVWFVVEDTLIFPMSQSFGTKNFIATVFRNQFPTNTIDWLIGKSLHIVSRDTNNAVNTGEAFTATRVIEQTATLLYPTSLNNDTTNAFPEFRWSQPPDVLFYYTYTFSLSRITPGAPVIVWTKEGISSIDLTLQYPSDGSVDSLQQGATYVWSISVVDEFGNYARSKESSFVVK